MSQGENEQEASRLLLTFPRRVAVGTPDPTEGPEDLDPHATAANRLKRALCVVTPVITTATDESFLQILIRELSVLFAAGRCSVQLLEAPGDIDSALRVAAHTGLPEAALRPQPAGSGGVARRVVRDGQPTLIVDRADLDQRFAGLQMRAEVGAAMCVPISTPRGVIFGVMNISRRRGAEGDGFSRSDIETCDAIAMLVGDALEGLKSRAAETELRERMRATERLSMMGELAAGIAHEVANPLATVRSNLGTLKSYLDDLAPFLEELHTRAPADVQNALGDLPLVMGDIMTGIQRAEDIIKRMKAMVRLDRTEVRESLRVSALAHDVLRLIRARIRSQVNVEVPDDLVVAGNSVDVIQILVNLIVNADDACQDQQALTGVPALIRVVGRTADDGIYIEVIDNGTGISAENLRRIFEPLFTTKSPGKGTGLGLSISRRLLEEQGGQLQVNSVVGQGTTFRLVLPAIAS
jgi:signal transduction histidine kinase